MENKPNTDNFDALLYAAVQYAGQSEMDLYDSMDVPGEFSASFTHRMKRWIKQKERKKDSLLSHFFACWYPEEIHKSYW